MSDTQLACKGDSSDKQQVCIRSKPDVSTSRNQKKCQPKKWNYYAMITSCYLLWKMKSSDNSYPTWTWAYTVAGRKYFTDVCLPQLDHIESLMKDNIISISGYHPYMSLHSTRKLYSNILHCTVWVCVYPAAYGYLLMLNVEKNQGLTNLRQYFVSRPFFVAVFKV